MTFYRKRPVVIEAVRFLPDTVEKVIEFLGGAAFMEGNDIIIPTKEGDMRASSGDWIIKGVKGEFYPCKPDIFDATYEDV